MIIQILFLYWLFAFANADTSTYTSNVAACKIPTNRLQPGLSVNIYSYDNSATTTLALEELYTGYTTLSRRYSNTVISSISLSAAGPTTMTTWGMTFGNEAIIIEFVSYFYVDQTGFYAFQSNNIDDGVMILIGLAAFKCGDVSGIGKGYTYLLYQQYKNPISAISDVYLEGGQYYPLRVVFFNDESAIFLNVNIQDSNSSTLDQKKVLFNDISDGDTPGCTAMYYPRAFATGCSIPSTVLQQGFDVNIYTFSSVTTLLSPSVYTSEYKSLSKVASNYGVVSSIYLNALSAYTMTNWGMTFWNSDIIIEILTYLYVEVSGIYIFQTFDTDDGVMIFIADNAFSCCDSTGIGSSNEYILYSQKLYARVTDFVDSNVYLTAGGYYPLRVIYYNLEIAAILELVILDPSGSEVNQHKALFNVPPSSQTEICELMTVYPTNSDGQPTNSDGLPVNSNGQPTNSNGAATNSNGQPTNSDGAATNSDGQPTNSNGQPTNSDGAATNSNGQPTNSDGAATNSNGQPTNSDGAATNSNGQPTNSDGAPTNSDGAATNSNGQPTNSDGAATNSNGQPTNSDGAATNSDGQPTNSNGQPTNSDGAATNSNGQPTNSDGAATNSNGQPTNSDGAATNSNGQPTNSNGAATNSNFRPTNSDGAATNSNGQPSSGSFDTGTPTSEVTPLSSSQTFPSVSVFALNQIPSYHIYIPSPWYNFEIFANTEEHFTWNRDSMKIEVENVMQSPSSYDIVFSDKEFALSYSLPFTNVATVTVAGNRTDTYPTCVATFVIQASPNEVIRKRDIFDITLTATVSFPEDMGRINRSTDVSVSIETISDFYTPEFSSSATKRTTDIPSKEENSIFSTSTHNTESITDSIMPSESTAQALEKITTSNNVISHYNPSSEIVGNAMRYSPTSGVSFGILLFILCLF